MPPHDIHPRQKVTKFYFSKSELKGGSTMPVYCIKNKKITENIASVACTFSNSQVLKNALSYEIRSISYDEALDIHLCYEPDKIPGAGADTFVFEDEAEFIILIMSPISTSLLVRIDKK